MRLYVSQTTIKPYVSIRLATCFADFPYLKVFNMKAFITLLLFNG